MYNRDNLKNIPKRPGIYIMHNHAGDIIYVGKAKNLFNRVHQYFQNPKKLPLKTQIQVSHVESIETIVVDTEMEALILECNLIKEHRPRYNIMLKDDKSYPYIKVTVQDRFPKIFMTRNHKRDGGKYFGPFTNSMAVRQTIEALQKVYPLHRCNRKLAYGVRRGRPCMYYHIGQCTAPCTGKLTEEAYRENVNAVLDILNGKEKELIDRLSQEMAAASKRLDFETAASKRDQIQGIQMVISRQKIISENEQDQDFIAYAVQETPEKNDAKAAEGLASVQIFNVRDGKLLGRHPSMMTGVAGESPESIMTNIVKQYYAGAHFIPKEIVLSGRLAADEAETIQAWLSSQRGSRVTLTVPQKGNKQRLIAMVQKNADLALSQYLLEKHQKEEKKKSRLDSLRDLLDIDAIPHRIEAYDISNISGSDNVGGMVVFEEGRPQRKAYRRFKIKTVEGQNDYGSMQEMLFRRIEHGIREMKEGKDPGASSFLPFPEIFMIDGGKTHVDAAKAILAMYPEIKSAVCGLVKDDHHQLRGLVYRDEEYKVVKGTPLSTLMNEISEEVHRFAIGYHRTLRKKGMLASQLESIPGIGKKRREALMRYYGNIQNIRNATVDEMCAVNGMNQKSAEAVVDFFSRRAAENQTKEEE